MTLIGSQLALDGWTLRSGGARGADSAFEAGFDINDGAKQIFLPFKGYEGNKSPLYERPPQAAYDLIDSMWTDVQHRTDLVRTMFARNCQQILGPNLDEYSDLVICWTERGKPVGGTGRAIKVAQKFGIPVVNLAVEDFNINLYGF
jgi:hypothetical protein